jgi:hypothetical protein
MYAFMLSYLFSYLPTKKAISQRIVTQSAANLKGCHTIPQKFLPLISLFCQAMPRFPLPTTPDFSPEPACMRGRLLPTAPASA